MSLTRTELDTALITAHGLGDGNALQRLYGQAAELFFGEGDAASGYFNLTHAYVHALANGDHFAADRLAHQLRTAGRL